jgi:hypothetical protein
LADAAKLQGGGFGVSRRGIPYQNILQRPIFMVVTFSIFPLHFRIWPHDPKLAPNAKKGILDEALRRVPVGPPPAAVETPKEKGAATLFATRQLH